MNRKRYTNMLGEREQLARFIAEVPKGDLISRMSWEKRLAQVNEEIENAGPFLAIVDLIFKGGAVFENRGIDPNFISEAIGHFSNMVSCHVVSKVKKLSSQGRLPHFLMITGTRIGSFGFEFEEVTNHSMAEVSSPVQASFVEVIPPVQASLDEIADFFQACDRQDRRVLKERLRGMHTRTRDRARDFFDSLRKAKSYFEIDSGKIQGGISDFEGVQWAYEFLEKEEYIEDEKFSGCFIGALPKGRKFEFRIKKESDLIEGTISEAVDVNTILRHLNVPIEVTFRRTEKETKPKYVLLEAPRWPSEEDQETLFDEV